MSSDTEQKRSSMSSVATPFGDFAMAASTFFTSSPEQSPNRPTM